MATSLGLRIGPTGRFLVRNCVRYSLPFLLMAFFVKPAAAQYGGGTGGGTGTSGGTTSSTYTAPSGGYSSAKGAAIGAGAAAGVALVFIVLHYRGRVTGCVQSASDGLRLVDQRQNESYTLFPGDVSLKPGERVLLKGKKRTEKSGTRIFEAKKLVKDYGSCETAMPGPASNPANP